MSTLKFKTAETTLPEGSFLLCIETWHGCQNGTPFGTQEIQTTDQRMQLLELLYAHHRKTEFWSPQDFQNSDYLTFSALDKPLGKPASEGCMRFYIETLCFAKYIEGKEYYYSLHGQSHCKKSEAHKFSKYILDQYIR